MTNVLIVPERNEKLKPLNVVERGLMSEHIDEVYIIDGWSTNGTSSLLRRHIPAIEKKYGKKIHLFYSELRNTGKGGAMVSGMRRALADGHERIVFLDADITSSSPDWCDVLVKSIDKHKVDMCRGYFDRAPHDAQITRHITKPMINMFFPEGRNVNQPLGGEICMTDTLAKYLLDYKIAPPHTWGIDTFFTIVTLTGGYKMAEQYLAQKVHNEKTLMDLRPMAIECFDEASKLVYYLDRYLKVPKCEPQCVSPVKELPRSSKIKRVGPDVRTMKYGNLDYEIDIFLNYLKSLNASGQITPTRINTIPLTRFEDRNIIFELLHAKTVDEFKEKSSILASSEWIRILDTLVRRFIHFNFSKNYYELAFILWEMRSLCFDLNEAKTFAEAERNTTRQAEMAYEFAQSKDIVL